jgi:hypothetical protein
MAAQPRAGRREPGRIRSGPGGSGVAEVVLRGERIIFSRNPISPLKNPSKSIFTSKIVKPFSEIPKTFNSGLGWCLLSFGSYLHFFGVNCYQTAIYFPFALIGAAGAGELIPEYDYAGDFTAEDYPTPGSRPTDSEIPIRHC